MARAKSTDRAEARRRYRAVLAAQAAEEAEPAEETEPDIETPAASTRSGGERARPADRRPVAGAARSQPRLGVIDALRVSIRPVNLREDLAALPDITLHSRAIWLPAVLMLIGAVAALATGEGVVRQIVVAVLYPTPMLPAFLAGILAPKAAYLAGGITGVIGGVIIFVFALVTSILPTASGQAATKPTADEAIGLFFYVILSGLLFGLVFGAFASFYRRFLSLSGASRNQQRGGGQKRGRAQVRGR